LAWGVEVPAPQAKIKKSLFAAFSSEKAVLPLNSECNRVGVPPVATISADTRPNVIVLGNEKGGSGKSTTAIHIIIGLMRDGYRLGALDLDARQGTLAGTLAARQHFIESKGIALPMPVFASVHRSTLDHRPRRKSVSVSTRPSPRFPKIPTSSSSTAQVRIPICRVTAMPMPTR
jgi:hypothetical protein